jgi:hypothetical protein
MKATEQLETIWQTYQITNDCLKIAKRSIHNNQLSLLKGTGFITATIDEAEHSISNSRTHADAYVILSLWAAFERLLLSYLLIESQKIVSINANALTQKIYQKINDNLEYWRIDEVLDIFKVVISADIIGQAKQIKEYRDWLAHRNPKKYPKHNVSPKMAYKILLTIAQQLEEQISH